ncbi:MAG TPA: hypothetical protein VE973_02710 [Candidatus Limnocylindria bacterium]|nr:hypothetical protein [Candidatus Limnocylindria bacterium]
MFTKETFKNEKAAIWAALLIAINPFQLQYVTEARMYTFGAFFALLAGYFLVNALNSQKALYEVEAQNMPNLPEAIKKRRVMFWNYAGFTLATIVIIYTHYYLFFTAAALGFYALIYLYFHHQGGIKKYVPILTSYILIFISFLPWLKTFLFQYRQVQAGYWISTMDRWSIPATFWDMLLSFSRDTSKYSTQLWLVIIFIFSLWMLYAFVKKTESSHKWLVVLAIAAPFGGAILFALLAKLKGSSSSVYLDRYFLFASIYFSIALAVWLKEIKIKWLSVSLLIIYILLNLIAYYSYWHDLNVGARPGMAGAAKFLQANVEPKQHVFVGTTFEFFNYKYYWETGFSTPVRPTVFTGGRSHANQMSHVDGVAMFTDEDLTADFKMAAHSQDTVWLVWTEAFGSHKPEIPLNWVQVDQKAYPDVRPNKWTVIYVTEYKVN